MVEQVVLFMVAVSLPLQLVVEQIVCFGTPRSWKNTMRRFALALFAVVLWSVVPLLSLVKVGSDGFPLSSAGCVVVSDHGYP